MLRLYAVAYEIKYIRTKFKIKIIIIYIIRKIHSNKVFECIKRI